MLDMLDYYARYLLSIKDRSLISEEYQFLSFGSSGRIEIVIVFLTCVGRRGSYTQRKDVMFQSNKDLFLFSIWERKKMERSALTWEQCYAVNKDDNW